MKTSSIRKKFIEYFKSERHAFVPRANLVPKEDKSLLFVNAGMVQFKPNFLGKKAPFTCAVTAQPCLRVGGKHNDLRNVGHTARHHTLFEMLGNFSFGDYSKERAIQLAWTFLTDHLMLPKEKLWVTVHYSDKESRKIWENVIKVPTNRVVDCGDEENFWAMGDTGPCGPCTEIFYDHGPDVEGGPPGSPTADGDRYIEVWNIVFMSYERLENGEKVPLPKLCVDTGMGLERIAAVLQNVHSNYEIDLFHTLIESIKERLHPIEIDRVSSQVVADHLRSIMFLLTDGITPGNEGRSYVLRRIIRRALRYLYQSGVKTPVLYDLLTYVVEGMGEDFPELSLSYDKAVKTLKKEEEKFFKTIEQGMAILLNRLKENTLVEGELAFKLYDTYGFPVDITEDIACEMGGKVDLEGYQKCMETQKARSKKNQQFKSSSTLNLSHFKKTEFDGYHKMNQCSKIVGLFSEGQPVDQIEGEGIIILDRTPFYPEGGGQVGDQGTLKKEHSHYNVMDTQIQDDIIYHFIEGKGSLHISDVVDVQVSGKRYATARHHSVTHLLHAALKKILGNHVSQQGSLVTSEKLRFDYNCDGAPSTEQKNLIEQLVNNQIKQSESVQIEMMSQIEAKKAGAVSMFGEKYPEQVRVLSMGSFSKELCGGTHVNNTGDIMCFKIMSDSALSSGVRRIEAVAGYPAIEILRHKVSIFENVQEILQVTDQNTQAKIRQLVDDKKQLEKKLKQRVVPQNWLHAEEIGSFKCFIDKLECQDMNEILGHVDHYKNNEKMISFLFSEIEGKNRFVISISKDLVSYSVCRQVMEFLALHLSIKGGGRDDLIQGVIANTTSEIKTSMIKLKSWIKELSF